MLFTLSAIVGGHSILSPSRNFKIGVCQTVIARVLFLYNRTLYHACAYATTWLTLVCQLGLSV